MDKQIAQFVIEDRITSFFAVRRKTLRESVRGQFISLELGDCTGRIDGVIWEPDHFSLAELEEGMVVKAQGVVGEFNHRLQLRLDQIRLATDNEFSLDEIMPHSPEPIEQRRARVLALIERVENSYIASLLRLFFEDENWFEDYLNAAAGKLWHHAYIGGLSEHSANVAELAADMSSRYDYLDRDLLIFGGLIHDAGKIAQYTTQTVIDFTTDGRLLGHIAIVDQWITEQAAEVEDMPPELLDKLRHIVLSHHGELEFGSPVVPQIPEAFILNFCDEIDSKMGAITRIRTRQGEPGWSNYVKLLGRYLYFDEFEANEK